MAEVGHSRNAARGAKNDTLARVAEDHIVESALLKSKLERYMGTLFNFHCHYHFHHHLNLHVTLNSQADRLT